MADPRVVLVTQKTRLEGLVHRYGTVGQAKFYVEHLGQDFDDYLVENEDYQRCRDGLIGSLQSNLPLALLSRELIPIFSFLPDDIVYVLGRDGLVANCMKYLNGQPVIGVNPSPERWIGILVPWDAESTAATDPELVLDEAIRREVSMAMVKLTDGQQMYAVNDLFVGRRTHASSRYELWYDGRHERQSSSGVIVSTGIGSSAWLKSIVVGAASITRQLYTGLEGPGADIDPSFPWDAKRLVFSVREPYVSPSSGADLTYGELRKGSLLEIVSGMPEEGVIFGDGVEEDSLGFVAGMKATIGLADKTGTLLVPSPDRQTERLRQ